MRLSSPAIFEAVSKTLVELGAKVIDLGVVALPPGPRVAIFGLTVYSATPLAPVEDGEVWNLFANPTPVEVLPLLVTVEEKVTGVFTVTVVGVQVGAEAVKSIPEEQEVLEGTALASLELPEVALAFTARTT